MAGKANKQVICDVLLAHAAHDRDIVVLCSDARGSTSLTPFAEQFPEQFVEVGIAEQSLVAVAAGIAHCGKKAFAASPACFLSTRSMEQIKVDVAYSHKNVKLIGVSGGVSYGALGMTHHSLQDIAAMAAIPGMRVYLPSDAHQTKCLIEALLRDAQPAYIRVGRNAVEDVYTEDNCPFAMDRATVLREGEDVALIACGEMVLHALHAAERLAQNGIQASVVDMYCVKPFDEETCIRIASKAKLVVSVEEHSPWGGLGSRVAQCVSANCPRRVLTLSLPDEAIVTGTSQQVFAHYGLDGEGIARTVQCAMEGCK